MRYMECHLLPTGRDWAAKALDFKAPGPFIQSVPGGELVAISTIAQPKALNIAIPTPSSNKEAQKDTLPLTTSDTNKEPKQDVTEGSTGLSQMDANFVQKEKRGLSTAGLAGSPFSRLCWHDGGRLLAIDFAYFPR